MQHSLTSAKLTALHRAVTADPDFAALPLEDLRPLPTTGLAHDHFRLGESDWLARVPKQSQFGFTALENLRYQAACFHRASRSGHAPQLKRLILPQPDLPLGALLVEYIAGRPLRQGPSARYGANLCLERRHHRQYPLRRHSLQRPR